ncbi:hypothetical protein [Phytohabitans suffuscus]
MLLTVRAGCAGPVMGPGVAIVGSVVRAPAGRRLAEFGWTITVELSLAVDLAPPQLDLFRDRPRPGGVAV